ncbi:MAG: hypothetical protein JSS02_29845 [Planctomycetes bacterium]|nr:hypothetical protein [Planctomycetota bacterium]
MVPLTETLVIVVAIVGAVVWRRQIRGQHDRFLTWLSERPVLAVVLAGSIGLFASVAYGFWQGIPIPGAHDEFSYLLAADTYAHGRLTNPSPPGWPHWENMHIIVQPTYMSKYPPGQGLVLALGQVVCGLPIAGAWLSVGLAAAAMCWMLQGYVPNGWACLAGIALGLKMSIGYWGQSYWGGALALVGGALLFGATIRGAVRPKWYWGVVLGAGLAILSVTRPYEGLVASAVAVVIWARTVRLRERARHESGGHAETGFGADGSSTSSARQALCWWCGHVSLVCAAFVVVGAALGWQAYNNFRITGAWWKLPYQVHDEQYAACPTFFWQPERVQPAYRHSDMEAYFVGWEHERYLKKRWASGFNGSVFTKAWILSIAFVGPLLAMPVLLAVWQHRVAGVWQALGVLGIVLLAMTQTLYLHPHYVAPFVGFVYLIAVQGFRLMRGFGRLGPALAPALCLAAVIGPPVAGLCHPYRHGTRRSALEKRLRAEPGDHLVLMQPGADYDVHEGWIYNLAELSEARILWARSLDPAADARLIEQFPQRTVWRLNLDRRRADLQLDTELKPRSTGSP